MTDHLSRRLMLAGAAATVPTLAFAQPKAPGPLPGTSVLNGRTYGPGAPPINYAKSTP